MEPATRPVWPPPQPDPLEEGRLHPAPRPVSPSPATTSRSTGFCAERAALPRRVRKVNGRFLGVYHAYPNAGYEKAPPSSASAGARICGTGRSRSLSSTRKTARTGRAAASTNLPRGAPRHVLPLLQRQDEARGWPEQTGVATSADLKTWKRLSSNPIIPNGGPGSGDEKFASDPCVLLDGSRWTNFYYSLDNKGEARDLLAPAAALPRRKRSILIDVGPPGRSTPPTPTSPRSSPTAARSIISTARCPANGPTRPEASRWRAPNPGRAGPDEEWCERGD